MPANVEPRVVESFGREWHKFDYAGADPAELESLFQDYFRIFPWSRLPKDAVGFDLGCGTGRWAQFVAPRVGHLHCIDPSDAIEIARCKLASLPNCTFHRAAAHDIPLPDASADFGYSLGVFHAVPDPGRAIADCVRKLKPGAPFLLYLYYAFDNRPWWFRALWRTSNGVRRLVSRMPQKIKELLADLLAAVVYWPLARLARLLEWCGLNVANFPLSAYRHRSFYVMRNDSLDRFGTALEHRFRRSQIEQMMRAAGLTAIQFSEAVPYWCAVGLRENG